jgi:hypothetical protein
MAVVPAAVLLAASRRSRPVGAASSSDGCQPREQLVTCEAPAYRVEAGSVASDVCCQIAAKNDQVPFVIDTERDSDKGFCSSGDRI